jgi:hypothetical protein
MATRRLLETHSDITLPFVLIVVDPICGTLRVHAVHNAAKTLTRSFVQGSAVCLNRIRTRRRSEASGVRRAT